MIAESYAVLHLSFGDKNERDPEECHVCGAKEASLEFDAAEHKPDCSLVTGVWFMHEDDAVRRCSNPDCGCLVGVKCARCGEAIDGGDLYRVADAVTGMLATTPKQGVAVCMACAEAQSDAIRAMLEA